MQAKDWALLIVSVVVCQIAGLVGSFFTAASIPVWYAALNKPFFTPPSWLFAPVWLTLFTLMGISLYLIITKKPRLDEKAYKLGLVFFGVQLFLNTLWSILFFGLRSPFLAFAEILALWAFIALTTYQFWRIRKEAAYLLLPYIAWVTVAAALNLYVWMLNP